MDPSIHETLVRVFGLGFRASGIGFGLRSMKPQTHQTHKSKLAHGPRQQKECKEHGTYRSSNALSEGSGFRLALLYKGLGFSHIA